MSRNICFGFVKIVYPKIVKQGILCFYICQYAVTISAKLPKIMKIPGLSFSLKRAVGISALKQKVSKAAGIPMTKQGLERKIGGSITKAITGKKKK